MKPPIELAPAVQEKLASIYEEIMWLAERPDTTPSAARAWSKHINSPQHDSPDLIELAPEGGEGSRSPAAIGKGELPYPTRFSLSWPAR